MSERKDRVGGQRPNQVYEEIEEAVYPARRERGREKGDWKQDTDK